MGFKCRFCRKGFGHNTYVGYQLQGIAGCGKCNGEFSDSVELDNTVRYYKDLIAGLQKAIDNNLTAIEDCDEAINKLKEYKESKTLR